MIEHSRANIVVVEDQKQYEKIREARKDMECIKAVIQYTGNSDQLII